MARSRPQQQPVEQAQVPDRVTFQAVAPGIPLEPPKTVEQVQAAARSPEEQKPDPDPGPVIRYRVLRESRIVHRGMITWLKAGKVIDGTNYNVPDLESQGVPLEALG